MKCIFSVDVEDWFHILDLPSTPAIEEWGGLPSRVEKNFMRLLDIFSEKNVHVTCFFLGWVAERFPHLVKEAGSRGHEIASHGYSHTLVYKMTEQDFFHDAVKAKDIIENISGQSVLGYRSPGFSTTERTPWFFDKLIEAGYRYDSSVFPASRGHGGLKSACFSPYLVTRGEYSIMEFPITVTKLFGKPFCFFGGGYLRLSPYYLLRRMTLKTLKEERPVIFYIHPREIDEGQPRLPMNLKRRFKSYVNLKTTQDKIHKILEDFEVTTFQRFMDGYTFAGR
ncbi:MAG: polysaccharide deacetylase family protein [Thermodesulfovibrionia bacterium]|nr:polysaccharide deacetylase family protein [Thermodesulfovibrionia bacterium]